jgi:DNA-binding transcriptional ArsR family regulator
VADPTRRRILDLLAARERLTVSEISEEFPALVTSGISKHLMGLRAAGLVQSTRQGRQQLYTLRGEAFAEALVPWLALYERYWTDALERLRNLAERDEAPKARREGSHPARSRPVRRRR